MRLVFKISSLDAELRVFHRFLNPGRGDWDWSKYILRKYPNLRKGMEKEELRRRLMEIREEKMWDLEKKQKKLKKLFGKKKEGFLKMLFDILELEKTRINKITVFTSLSPINPRDIRRNEFWVYFDQKVEDMLAVCMHEILHFFYFEKWRKVFHKSKLDEFNGPHIVWHLSEIVTPIILNENRFQKILEYKHEGYDEYYKLKFDGKNIYEKVEEIYNQRENFEDFLRESYKFVKRHEKEIQKI